MNFHQPEAGVPLYKVEQIREVEANYAQQTSLGTYPLMEAAGQAAFTCLQENWPGVRNLLIMVGKGNNGGDGLVVARLAVKHGLAVSVCLLGAAEDLVGDAAKAWQKLDRLPIQWCHFDQLKLEQYEVVVDALLGTGIHGAVREPFVSVINRINAAQLPVLAIDIPSGLDADSGTVANTAIKASTTISFIGYKRGLYTADAANYRGRLILATLDVAASCYPLRDETIDAQNWESLKHLLRPRKTTAHKGDFGHCRIIGGSSGMNGAAILAATAAARCGAGLTSAWLECGEQALLTRCPEVMARRVELGAIKSHCESLNPSLNLVIGPGLGREEWAQSWMHRLLKHTLFNKIRKILDADALNWLAENPAFDEHWILTPHPGEAARLLGVTASQVNADRFSASLQIAQRFGGVCVLKGAGTVISNQQGRQTVCAVGNPGMASGGMGDVLSGVIGSLLAQGYELFDAAQLGVAIHGEAADRAAGSQTQYRGMLASDLIAHFGELLNPQ